MDFLLDDGADIEARDSGERTLLILAIDSGWAGAVELLLERGPDPDVEDLFGLHTVQDCQKRRRYQRITGNTKSSE
jgi:ankyrin repeat protein